jgi:tetrahydromethanopterin S-methyltransferase subunit B
VSEGNTNLIGIKDVFEAVNRLEGKVDSRLNALDAKVDTATSRLDRLEGAISLIKWLGPVGLVGLVYGIGKGAGYW